VNDPNFFSGLDEWEKEDDRRAKTVTKLIEKETGESLKPKLAD